MQSFKKISAFAVTLLAVVCFCCTNPVRLNAQTKIVLPKTESVAQPKYPVKPVGVVNDFDSLFTKQQRSTLEQLIKRFTDSNGYEFAVVTLRAEPGVKGNLDSLGTLIADSWGVGSKKYDDGVTIVICAGCREMRIANGLGTAQVLSDQKSKGIVDNSFLPAFKRGAYFEGVEAGLLELMRQLHGKRPPPSN
jgi:uncharacterized protein